MTASSKQYHKKITKIVVFGLQLGLLYLILHAFNNFSYHVKVATAMKTMEQELAKAVLPLNSLLSKVASNPLSQQRLTYQKQADSYKLNLFFPSIENHYNLLDCRGNIFTKEHKVNISIVWQKTTNNHYKLICQGTSANNKNITEVLFAHIDGLVINFAEKNDSSNVKRYVDYGKLQDRSNIMAVQLSLLVRSHEEVHKDTRYQSFMIGDQNLVFKDRFLRKPVVMTIPLHAV